MRYGGGIVSKDQWAGKVVWADKIKEIDRLKVLDLLKLPKTTGPESWWLTEFEDNWPYQKAPSDLYFHKDYHQETVKRKPRVVQAILPGLGDITIFALAVTLVGPPVVRRMRRARTA
jgi:hypothetical protein